MRNKFKNDKERKEAIKERKRRWRQTLAGRYDKQKKQQKEKV